MKFNKVYIELTNICGLTCSFCPTKELKPNSMDLDFFENILLQLKPYTKEITYHMFGDPLTLSNLEKYLDISHKHNFKVHITTTGYFLDKHNLELFLHPAIKQINFSLNSYNKNEMAKTLDEYLKPMFELCDLKLEKQRHHFINFRLWNIDTQNSEENFNQEIFRKLEEQFHIELSNLTFDKPKRLENQILLHFDKYFKWPSLDNQTSTDGYCQGLSSHFGILSSGIVVPCCLDCNGIIKLGNLHEKNLPDILNSQKAQNIINGFINNIAVEELCKKCTYKNRF